MTGQIRYVAIVMALLFGALFVNLNYLQVLRAAELAEDDRNVRGLLREYEVRRGSIIVGEGQAAAEIARSEETEGFLRYLRRYPEGPLFGHVTGFHSHIYGRTQVESQFNDFLAGTSAEAFGRNLVDLLTGREREGDDVITTIRPAVQGAARDALGDRMGAVVALHPATGELLAVWSAPTYDPNRFSTHDGAAARQAWTELNDDPGRPMLNRAFREWYPPGSTYKVVTAAAALEAGIPPDRTYPDPVRQELPLTTATIGNFGGGTCNQGRPITMHRALEVSCNTTFAQIGLEIGDEALVEQSRRFGLNHAWDFQLPLQTSHIPEQLDPPQTAQSAIGQRDVRVTPLQMAMITAAIGNDGVLVTPRMVRRVQDFGGRTLREYPADQLVLPGRPDARAVSVETAHRLRDMMVGVVAAGTGRRAAIADVTVAGKTGTAQHSDGPPTVWFTGFAPAEQPVVAVAVVVEAGGEVGHAATGGALAAPIARAVMEAALAEAGAAS
jgi:penicillin-binding protein A